MLLTYTSIGHVLQKGKLNTSAKSENLVPTCIYVSAMALLCVGKEARLQIQFQVNHRKAILIAYLYGIKPQSVDGKTHF